MRMFLIDGWCPILVMAPKLQEEEVVIYYQLCSLGLFPVPQSGATRDPGHGTKMQEEEERFYGRMVHLLSSIWCHKRSWSQHQNLTLLSGIILFQLTHSSKIMKPGAMRCHGTRGCKRCPSTSLYELLSLNFNSLFSSLLLSWPILDVYIYRCV